jgi:hypothetical protein
MSPPSSRPPAGIPDSGGNAKYALVAVVLLLGVGGLFWWRSSSSHNTETSPIPPVAPSLAMSTPTVDPRFDDIPPPPPADTTPEAGPGGKTSYVPSGTGGCEGKCGGVSPPELSQALAVRGNAARRCYNQGLANDSSLKGHVTIAVRVGPSGNVCSATVAANDMGSSGVANCAANVFRQVTYPAPRGGCVDATVPLSFVPQGGGQ